jgi:hypothetical protein
MVIYPRGKYCNRGRNPVFRILVCFKGVNLHIIYEGALPEK